MTQIVQKRDLRCKWRCSKSSAKPILCLRKLFTTNFAGTAKKNPRKTASLIAAMSAKRTTSVYRKPSNVTDTMLNKIIYGDCLEVMGDIPDGSIDMILCDLPYGITACKWDSVIPFEPLWAHYKRIIKSNGAIVLFGSQPFTSALIMSNPKWFKHEMIWDKVTASGFQIAKYRPMKQHENILIFGNGTLNYHPIMIKMDKPDIYYCASKSESSPLHKNDGLKRIRTHKFPKSIIISSNANKKGNIHPTQKPVALLEYLIKTYTNEGETVLDNCIGSGSTAIAAINTNRNFIGIEKDRGYFDIACKRIAEHKQQIGITT